MGDLAWGESSEGCREFEVVGKGKEWKEGRIKMKEKWDLEFGISFLLFVWNYITFESVSLPLSYTMAPTHKQHATSQIKKRKTQIIQHLFEIYGWSQQCIH